MNEAQVRAQLTAMVEATVDPVLSDPEIDDLMEVGQRADMYGNLPYLRWRASAGYNAGDYVVSKPRNGHLYKCTVAGTSGTNQPAFPTASGATVTDGGVTWQEVGTVSWVPTFDIFASAAEGWRRKAGKVAPKHSYAVNRQQVDQSQVYDHCLAQAKEYASKITGSVSTAGWGQPPLEPPWGIVT